MSLQQTKVTALYLRLSNDDGNAGDSDSIVNQRSMLYKYAEDNCFRNIVEFVDDGFSGSNFQRPSFQQMLTMAENGEIGTIIVKDLSRLGREYIQMGMFTEIIFPKYNIDFIAINDSVDSRKGENDFAAFKNLFNEYFVRDTSRKIRAVIDMRQRKGERINSSAPYGYIYDGEKLIIDEEAAAVVKRVFALCASGIGASAIANTLTAEKVPTPFKHKGHKSVVHVRYPERWNDATVRAMLGKKEYIGHTITKKSHSVSYKQKKRIKNDEADSLIFYNTHEPIIDADTFEIMQNIHKHKRRRTLLGEQPIFSGLVYCFDCGSVERYNRGNGIEPRYYAYNCGTYRSNRPSCTPHGIRFVVLEKLVLEHIHMVTGYLAENEQYFADRLKELHLKDRKSDVAKKKRELDKAKCRIQELDRLFTKLYEDRTLGTLPEDRYIKMTAAYEQEQAELKSLIESLEQEVSKTAETLLGIDKFLRIARKYLNLQELNGTILRELIEKVVVHEKDKSGGTIRQQIDIHYNFVGVIDKIIT